MIRRILVGGLYIGFVSFVLFYFLLQGGESVESARNITLLLMVLFENVHVFNSRTEMNFLYHMKYKSSETLMHIPFMQNVLSTQPVSLNTWLLLATFAMGLVAVMEADKWLMLKREMKT